MDRVQQILHAANESEKLKKAGKITETELQKIATKAEKVFFFFVSAKAAFKNCIYELTFVSVWAAVSAFVWVSNAASCVNTSTNTRLKARKQK